jgi:hypothetical protein
MVDAINRLEKRMEALQRVKLDGYNVAISELETELDYLSLRPLPTLCAWSDRMSVRNMASTVLQYRLGRDRCFVHDANRATAESSSPRC